MALEFAKELLGDAYTGELEEKDVYKRQLRLLPTAILYFFAIASHLS